MQYDVITLDTNIFSRNGYYLEGGMLGQLSQFKEGSAKLVVSEIVLHELHSHLKREAEEAGAKLGKATKDAVKNGLLVDEAATAMTAAHGTALSPADAAKKRIEAFAEKTGLEVIPAEGADIKELVKRYFAPSPPFEDSGKKKNEFPDAIALLSLEKWAKEKSKKILAISDDGGWADFGKDSEHIDVEADLTAALQKLQAHADQAEKIVASLLAEFGAGKRPDDLRRIANALDYAVSSLSVYAEGSSAYPFEEEQMTLTFQNFDFLDRDSGYDFSIVQIGKGKIVAKIGISIKARAEAEFSFAVYDSTDRDYTPIGSSTAEMDIEFEAAILVTFEGDFTAQPPVAEVTAVELVEAIDSVDFGEIGPDYGDDPDR